MTKREVMASVRAACGVRRLDPRRLYDAQDGRCHVRYAAECGIKHRDDGGEKCKAQAVYCTRHGWMWCQDGE